MAFHGTFEFKLDLAIVGRKAKADFIHEFARECKVGPARKELMPLVLQTELTTFVKLGHHSFHFGGLTLVSDVLQQ